jgi:hypothetical protein
MNNVQHDDNPYRSPPAGSTQVDDPSRKSRRRARALLWTFALGLVAFTIGAAGLWRVTWMEFRTDPVSVSELTLTRLHAISTAASSLCLAGGAIALLAGVAWLWTQYEPRGRKASANPTQAPDESPFPRQNGVLIARGQSLKMLDSRRYPDR